MASERTVSRMTLRDLMTQAGKLTREATEVAGKMYQERTSDLQDLSRTTRRKSQYPSVVSLQNAVQRFGDCSKDLLAIMASLDEHLEAIRDQSHTARLERRR